jgi:superfamily II DNA/RNA helicase
MLFSATLDGGVDVLVKRFLTNPVTHSVDSAESPVSTMSHHVLHIRQDDRLKVLVDLAAAPGRTLVFTRTKQRAKRLTRELIASGVPAVELHGNLAQNARTRNLLAFSDGTANTLVATDIAARGIHVDDVALVIHADPPMEHKAYLHRSGRTARAGADGIVVTLMTDDQVADVRDLTRRAAIRPTTTNLRPGHPLLAELAPGERTFTAPPAQPAAAESPQRGAGRSRNGGSGNGTSGNGTSRNGGPRNGGSRHGTSDNGAARHGTSGNRAARHGTSSNGGSRHGTSGNAAGRDSTSRNGAARISASAGNRSRPSSGRRSQSSSADRSS